MHASCVIRRAWIAVPKDRRERADDRDGVQMTSLDSTELLEAAMRGSWERQTALTDNITNAETPGYQAENVDFQATLRDAIASGESPSQIQFQPEVEQGSTGPNGNGVDVDQESALLAENGLEYQALTDVLGADDSIMRAAM